MIFDNWLNKKEQSALGLVSQVVGDHSTVTNKIAIDISLFVAVILVVLAVCLWCRERKPPRGKRIVRVPCGRHVGACDDLCMRVEEIPL